MHFREDIRGPSLLVWGVMENYDQLPIPPQKKHSWKRRGEKGPMGRPWVRMWHLNESAEIMATVQLLIFVEHFYALGIALST